MAKKRFRHRETHREVFAEVETTTRLLTTDRPASEYANPGDVRVWTPDATEQFILPRAVFDTLYQEIE